jgi:hypothetical protein
LFHTYPRNFFPREKPFDRESIMAFPIPSEFTSGDFEIGQNMSLSLGDKEFVALLYPYDDKAAPRKPRRSSPRRRSRRYTKA